MDIKFKILRITLGFFAIASISCAAQQAPTTSPESRTGCPQIQTLLTAFGNPQLFDQPADAFLAQTNSTISAEQDKTSTGSSGRTMRRIKFSPSVAGWLMRGQLQYEIINGKAFFEDATFILSPSCFKKSSDMIELARKSISPPGKYNKTAPPDSAESLYWDWKDPNINMIRTLSVSAASDSYFIKALRSPDSKGVAE